MKGRCCFRPIRHTRSVTRGFPSGDGQTAARRTETRTGRANTGAAPAPISTEFRWRQGFLPAIHLARDRARNRAERGLVLLAREQTPGDAGEASGKRSGAFVHQQIIWVQESASSHLFRLHVGARAVPVRLDKSAEARGRAQEGRRLSEHRLGIPNAEIESNEHLDLESQSAFLNPDGAAYDVANDLCYEPFSGSVRN